jgi:hypothetical protein
MSISLLIVLVCCIQLGCSNDDGAGDVVCCLQRGYIGQQTRPHSLPVLILRDSVPHAPALTHMLCRTKHVSAVLGVSCFNPCFDPRTPREAIILIHALTLIDHQRVRYACGMGTNNKADRGWNHTPSTTTRQSVPVSHRPSTRLPTPLLLLTTRW